MATYQELKTRSQQVRDEQNIGGNTALRVGQLLMDIVKYFYDNDAAASEYLQQHFAMVNDGTHLLNWQQSPIVILHTMGEAYDDGDFSSLSQGENYYRAGFIMEANGQGGGINGETPKANALYVNLANDTLYTWNGASFDAITSGGGGSISGDDIIKNAYYSNGNLVLVIETENGDKTVTIPVTFDASNYVPTSRTVNGKALSNNITLSQSDIPGLVAALAAKVGYIDDEWLQVKAGAMQAATAVPNTTTVNGKQLSNNIVIGMADIPGLLQAIANAGSGAVSVTTNQDGTFVIHVGETDYTINLNHTHDEYLKVSMVNDASQLPATLDEKTIYGVKDSGEIAMLYVGGLPFYGGGASSGPVLRSPSDGSTINMETVGGVITKTIHVKGNGNLTQALTIGLSGTGYSFGLTQPTGVTIVSTTELTVTAAAANAGVDIVVVYSGSKEIAGATLSIVGTTDNIDCDVTLNYNNLTPLSFIKSTGSQCLVTNYFPNPNTHLEIDMQFEANGNASVSTGMKNNWLGTNGTPTNGLFRSNFNAEANLYYEVLYWFEKGYVSDTWVGVYKNVLYNRSTWVYKNNKVTFNGKESATETKTTTQDKELVLFGNITDSVAPFDRHNLKIWSVKIYENNTLLHKYLPYQRVSDGANGLYDTETGDFFASETSTNFIGG